MEGLSKQSYQRGLIWMALVAVLAGVYFYRPAGLYFLGDDFIHIPESKASVFIQRATLRPVGNLSLHLDYLWSATNAYGYHVTNLFLHAFNTVLVALVSKQILNLSEENHRRKQLPILTAALFFIYPFHSEAVFWIIGRSATLGSLFFLLATIFFLQREKSVALFITSLLAFEVSLLAYESAWIFPLVALAIVVYEKGFRGMTTRTFVYLLLVVIVFVTHLVFRYKVTHQLLAGYEANHFVHFNAKQLAANLYRLLARTVLPPFISTSYFVIASLLAFVACVWLMIKLHRLHKDRTLFWLITFCWLISYLPYLSLGIDTHGVEGERYLYLPSVFFCIWLLYLLSSVVSRRTFAFAYLLLVAAGIYFLICSRQVYTRASVLTATTIRQVALLPGRDVIYFENVPQYSRGAVVFRLGLKEAIHWLVPSFKGELKIVSIDDSDIRIRAKQHKRFEVIAKKQAVENTKEARLLFSDSTLIVQK